MNIESILISIIIITISLFILAAWIKVYNHFKSLSVQIKRHLAEINVVLKQRILMYKALSDVASNYSEHEFDTQRDITDLRGNKADGIDVTFERYPNLKASEIHKSIVGKDSISNIEERIRQRIKNHNVAVQLYNVMVCKFPTNIIARIHRFESLAYFSFDDTEYDSIPVFRSKENE